MPKTNEEEQADIVAKQMQEGREELDEAVEEMMQIFAHPQIGAVLRYMQEMAPEDRKSLQIVASAFAGRHKQAETA